MATTAANTKSVNRVEAPVIKIVNTIPERVATGWLKSSALS